MRRILVVSDNKLLAKSFQDVVKDQCLDKIAYFQYRYSSVNKAPSSMVELGFCAIDLRNPVCIESLVAEFDMIWSIHCKQIFDAELVCRVPCFNLHPGFNPYNRGWYPQVFSIINKQPLGATIHIMVPEVDAGPIVAQENIAINSWDTSIDLYEKIQVLEISLLRKHLAKIIGGEFKSFEPDGHGQFNSLNDFRRLCHLDLNSCGTLRDNIDLLRALSHGDFDNAYFFDGDGNKVFVKILLKHSGEQL